MQLWKSNWFQDLITRISKICSLIGKWFNLYIYDKVPSPEEIITWCRKWQWFDTYIWGKSINFEDFCRNPAEILRDTYFPFIVKDVKSYSVFNLRCGYISALHASPSPPQGWLVPMGNRKLVWSGERWTIIDLRIWNPWWTKFCNAIFFVQIAVSFKYYIPIPYVSMVVKIAPWYFQFGLGWGPEVRFATGIENCAVLCAKLRFVNEKTSNETEWNPSDVLGYYEGTI